MSCCKTYDPCLDGKLNQIGSYASVARQSAQNSATSANQAAASMAQAQSVANSLESFYLGPKSSPPTTDNQGNPLQEGALYWNTVTGSFSVWDGSSWIALPIGLITNIQIDPAAAIDHSKLASIPSGEVLLGNSSNIPTATAIFGDIAIDSAGVTSIQNGVIIDSDISPSAAIDEGKLAIGTARQLLQTNAGSTSAEWTSNVDIPGTLDVSGATVLDSSLTVSGDTLINGAGMLGYTTGSGGTVTQTVSRTTSVIIDKTNGAVELVSAAGSATWQSFNVVNNNVVATDTIIVNQKSGVDEYMIHVTKVDLGFFTITFATTGGTTTEQPVFNFSVIKAVTA
jgi:hypothetical protein